ncbi:ATP-binding protein [Halomicroarcula limicola]|uniref:ATP-binding protein n=1 Tax=Haloarcula limicola TaxID=1429915 RepID=A0A8J7Y4S6_9EURY|nr:ATP-binding protein [Halomicroarcula limicola]MBV0924750.1 ATP-binding protein [Halomicroarcula limicola]
MSESSDRAGLPKSVEYQPLPNIYRAFAAGASPYAIVSETIDNSIDFVRRQALDGAKYPDTLKVEVRYEPPSTTESDAENSAVDDQSPERLIIVDNAGGVPPNELARFFQLGHTDAPPEGIGRFGVGAKRLIGIGDRIKYESHANGYEVAAGFEVDARDLKATENNKLADDDVYQSDVYRVDDLEEGHTRIIVEDLNENVWSNLLGRDRDEIDERASDSLWRLGETYEHFLRNGIHIAAPSSETEGSIEFELSWSGPEHGEQVDVPNPVQLSWLPLDGLHPRRYERLPFANTTEIELEDALRADITVALMPSSKPKDAGLTVTMNNRNVLFRDTDNDLFSTRYLGKFRESQGHGRLHCVIELYGPAEDMPWSDTKDGLDGTQEITDHLLNVTENALSEYRRQTYENLPKWILAAYSGEDIQTFDNHIRDEISETVETIDKSNSKVNSPRFNEKPGSTATGKYYRLYPERDGLIKRVRLHSELRIRADDSVAIKGLPAYRRYFETEYDHESITELSPKECPDPEDFEVPVFADSPNTIPLIEDIKKLAETHAAEERAITNETDGVPAWLLPRYQEEFKQHGTTLESATTIGEFDFDSWRAKHSTSEDVRRGPEFSEPESEPSPDQPDSPDKRPTRSSPADRLIESSSETTGRSSSGNHGGSSSTTETSKGQSSEDSTDLSNFQRSSVVSDSGTEEASIPEREVPSPDFDSQQLEELRSVLELDDDASMATVVDTVRELQSERQRIQNERKQLINYLEQLSDVVNFEMIFDEPPDLEALKEDKNEP